MSPTPASSPPRRAPTPGLIPGGGQRPCQRGSRRSANALGPSAASSLASTRSHACAVRAATPRPRPRRWRCGRPPGSRARRRARWQRSLRRARAPTAGVHPPWSARSRAEGVASTASIVLPVRINSSARSGGTMRGRRWRPPAPAMIPRRTSGDRTARARSRHDVARERDLEAAGEREAVDGCDRRLEREPRIGRRIRTARHRRSPRAGPQRSP